MTAVQLQPYRQGDQNNDRHNKLGQNAIVHLSPSSSAISSLDRRGRHENLSALSNRRSPFPQHRRQQWRSCRSATRNGWPHITDGYGAETARARTCGFRAFVGNASMDFSLSALRFIVAVSSFFGFNVRVLDSLMKAPSNSPTLDNEAELHGCGV